MNRKNYKIYRPITLLAIISNIYAWPWLTVWLSVALLITEVYANYIQAFLLIFYYTVFYVTLFKLIICYYVENVYFAYFNLTNSPYKFSIQRRTKRQRNYDKILICPILQITSGFGLLCQFYR